MGITTANAEPSTYIVDSEYRIVAFNERLGKIFPDLKCGDYCYSSLCKEESPCACCPILSNDQQNEIFYNSILKKWLDIRVSAIQWPGAGTCHILFSKQLPENNQGLLYNLASVFSYEELYELNITKNTYKVLYHSTKFILSNISGNLSTLIQKHMPHLVHPDDQQSFQEFWSHEALLAASEQMQKNSNLSVQFRRKKPDGTFCWTLQTAVPLLQNANTDQIIMCFIQDIDQQKLSEEQEGPSAKTVISSGGLHDSLTGLYRRTSFLQISKDLLQKNEQISYCMVAIDIEHFKLYNEWYGQDAGDLFLIHIGKYLKNCQDTHGGVAGYMGADDFAIVLPYQQNILAELEFEITSFVKQNGNNAGFLPAFGVYPITNPRMPTSTMYDRAAIALTYIKGNYAKRLSLYDKQMMQTIEQNHVLLTDVQRALKSQEFTFFVQPKCNMSTGKIIGFESLVRWIHPIKGMISPGDFIPLLEQNGFIAQLDCYIWDLVCQTVRSWLDKGYSALPISVNVSRIDIYSLNVPDVFEQLIAKYHLKKELIEIEITESAYVENSGTITSVVESLRAAGFTVLMDDFGSGYSSLNMLKDANVDILKLDMKFLDMNEASLEKGVGILEAIVNMARLLGLSIIVEGVETEHQRSFLLDMGCIYGQGFHFYRPMPLAEIELLLANKSNLDLDGIKVRPVETLSIKELMNEYLFNETMLNNILGPIAFYDVYDDMIELIQANEPYYNLVKSTHEDLESYRKTILQQIYEYDKPAAMNIFYTAAKNPLRGGEGDIRRQDKSGSYIWIHLKVFLIKEQGNHKYFYGAINNITAQKYGELKLEASERALSATIPISEDESFMKLSEENRRKAASIFAQMTPGGMLGAYCEEGFPLYFASAQLVTLMGYDSYADFAEAIHYQVINTIHPEDREQVSIDLGSQYYVGQEYTTTYRMPKKDGTWFWVLDKGKVIQTEDGRLAIISACTDISEPLLSQQQLLARNSITL